MLVTARCADQPARRRGEACINLGHPVDARRSGQVACYRHRLLMKQVMSYWRVIDTDTCIRTADAVAIVNIGGGGARRECNAAVSRPSRGFDPPNSFHSLGEQRARGNGRGESAVAKQLFFQASLIAITAEAGAISQGFPR